ncbi:KAP family P-loop NTPase fold protein [Snodgrassella communis]|uniref:KAP family P-loop NTPase fold protein n=1 Tax=Snodgrassella communis TaxID=2946699 RepID=UPI001EF6EC7C|nr:P-loop NTPase fold protein [Snodgrassella communis]
MDKPKKLKKCQQVEIDAADPFKNDVLNRKANVEILTQFITSYEQSIVLCIDAGWGQGKTTFIKMWQQYLKNQDIPTIYFNAWESDYTDDALIALIGEIGLSIQELVGEDKTIAEKLLGHLYKLAVNFTKAAAPTMVNLIIKAVCGSLTDADEVSKASGNLSESLVKEQITKYEESRKTLGSFKEALSELARCYADGDAHKPMVIFIDELDRCRPNFAIEVLEKAKHLFNVDNIVFVLATDKTQLGHSIRAVYGQGLDVNGYLRRFIDFDYLLPILDEFNFIDSLFKKFSLNEHLKSITNYPIENVLKYTIGLYKLTLREQEAFCNILNIVVRTNNHFVMDEYFLLCLLIVLKLKFPDLYNSLNKNNKNNFIDKALRNLNSQYSAYIDFDFDFDLHFDSYYLEFLELILLTVVRPDPSFSNEEIIDKYVREYEFDDTKKQKLIKSLSMLGRYQANIYTLLLIKQAIEISTSFKLDNAAT